MEILFGSQKKTLDEVALALYTQFEGKEFGSMAATSFLKQSYHGYPQMVKSKSRMQFPEFYALMIEQEFIKEVPGQEKRKQYQWVWKPEG